MKTPLAALRAGATLPAMSDLQGNRGRQGRALDWERLAPELASVGWRVLLITVAVALAAGLLYPVSRTSIPEDPLLQSFDCPAPPCFPQTFASRAGDLAVLLPPFGYALALLLCVPGLVIGARHLLAGRDAKARPGLLAFFGTVIVLVGIDILPHVANPCLTNGPRLTALCGEFAGRWDVQNRWHTLLHALLGAVPMTLLFAWVSGRWRPGRRGSVHSEA
jgi:hypothetical protein